jgi:hypothetical protein
VRIDSEIGFKKVGENAETHLKKRPDRQETPAFAREAAYSEKNAIRRRKPRLEAKKALRRGHSVALSYVFIRSSWVLLWFGKKENTTHEEPARNCK